VPYCDYLSSASAGALRSRLQPGSLCASFSDLAVWIDVTVYDPTDAIDIAAPPYSLTVNLGATFSNIAVYDPMVGTTPIATYSNVRTVNISVTDHPLIVQVN
jgi:hypothetical protein